MKFVKMHGLGNDFVFFGGEDARRVEENGPAALAQKLCQKHFGVCADGLVLILPSASCDARMRIFNPDGSERPLTEEELLEYLSRPEVEYREDGSVWVHWLGQSVDITGRFDDGLCYVKLENGGEALYLTVEYGGGYTASPHRYVAP